MEWGERLCCFRFGRLSSPNPKSWDGSEAVGLRRTGERVLCTPLAHPSESCQLGVQVQRAGPSPSPSCPTRPRTSHKALHPPPPPNHACVELSGAPFCGQRSASGGAVSDPPPHSKASRRSGEGVCGGYGRTAEWAVCLKRAHAWCIAAWCSAGPLALSHRGGVRRAESMRQLSGRV